MFDPDGKYLFYRTGRTFAPCYGELDTTWIYANTDNLAAVPLRKDVPSPLAPAQRRRGRRQGQGQEGRQEGRGQEGGGEEGGRGQGDGEVREGREEGREASQAGAGEDRPRGLRGAGGGAAAQGRDVTTDLAAVSGKLFYRRLPRIGSGEEKSPIVFYDLKKREEKTVLEDVDAYRIAAGGEKLLVGRRRTTRSSSPRPDQKMEKKIDTSELRDDGGPGRRVAADLQRRLALRAGLLLRPGHARRGLERDARALRQRCSTDASRAATSTSCSAS